MDEKTKIISKAVFNGGLAVAILLLVYFVILTLVSGWSFAKVQFFSFWYFIVGLAIGFGIQIGLYSYLRDIIHSQATGKPVLAITGTTSTVAMVSCCAHYVVNLVPLLGFTFFVTLVSQYQIQLFWVGIIFNIIGILYMLSRIIHFVKKNQYA